MPQTLTIAVCMSNGMTLSDFITSVEILSMLNMADHPMLADTLGASDVPYRVKIEYLAPSLGPVSSSFPGVPTVDATQTYEAAIKSGVQFDAIWIPTGTLPDLANGKDLTPPEEIEFIKHQTSGAKYVLSVGIGSLALATAGVLDGKRATTNKAFYRAVESISSKRITWVPKARWVVDGNIWTSSGITAGADMALAFIEHLIGPKNAGVVRGIFEVPERGEDDDPFAKFHGLV